MNNKHEPSQKEPEIAFDDFTRVDIRIGTVLSAELNLKARNPAYVLTIDLGALGIKKSSAQVTQNYEAENIIGKQVVCVVNFPSKNVAGVISEVLVLASVSERCGTILLTATHQAPNGSRVL